MEGVLLAFPAKRCELPTDDFSGSNGNDANLGSCPSGIAFTKQSSRREFAVEFSRFAV